jgi:hypothetical protein
MLNSNEFDESYSMPSVQEIFGEAPRVCSTGSGNSFFEQAMHQEDDNIFSPAQHLDASSPQGIPFFFSFPEPENEDKFEEKSKPLPVSLKVDTNLSVSADIETPEIERRRDHFTPQPPMKSEEKSVSLSASEQNDDLETSISTPQINKLRTSSIVPVSRSNLFRKASAVTTSEQTTIQCRKNQQWRNIVGSGEKRNSGKKSLSLRADVMNKNYIRAFRREIKNLFDRFLLENGFTNSRSGRIFKANLRRFSAHLLEKTKHFTKPENFSEEEFQVYIGLMVNIAVVKKVFPEEKDTQKTVDFNNLLYVYSHKKFFEFATRPEMVHLVKSLFTLRDVSSFVQSYDTLSSHTESYRTHIQNLIDTISKD